MPTSSVHWLTLLEIRVPIAAPTRGVADYSPSECTWWLVAHGSYDVGTLAERVGMSVAAVSQHLAKLRLAGVISGQRDGRRQLYTVNDPHVLTLIQQIFDHIAPDGSLAPDRPPTSGSVPAQASGFDSIASRSRTA